MLKKGICEHHFTFKFTEEEELLIPRAFPDICGWSVAPIAVIKVSTWSY